MRVCLISFFLLIVFSANAQFTITGRITDRKNVPLIGANVYIKGTIEGASSDQYGNFHFETEQSGEQILVVSCIGFKNFELKDDVTKMQGLVVVLEDQEIGLDEVVITASTFSIGKSRTLKKMDALDVVLSGGSQGDIFGALQALPGAQKVGEDGKLYIRGGEDRETKTFIDGMHVLFPYTSTAENVPSRSRFSSFLFKGINFSLGGYDSEYGQALSSVLPMETKDVAATKIGVNVSPLSCGGGGTFAWGRKSISANINYTNLKWYNELFADRYEWKKDYRNIAGEVQFKSELGRNTVHKLFVSADRTAFIRTIDDDLNEEPIRDLGLNRNNYYINSTLSTRTAKNYHLFFGAAYSYASDDYDNAELEGDQFVESERELHLKAKLEKSVSKFFKVRGGLEAYLNTYEREYSDFNGISLQDDKLAHNLYAAYWDNQFKLVKNLYANLSARVEFADFIDRWNFSPRFSLNYLKNGFQFSGIVGKYYQSQENPLLIAANNFSRQESAVHYILGGSYDMDGTLFKLEAYKKDYEGLALMEDNIYTSKGFGSSKGIDVYLMGKLYCKRLEYTLSYSYNDSERLYKDYPVEAIPLFSTKHNANISLKYVLPSIRTYIGAAYTYASGRPYKNPNKTGFINSETDGYHSLDLNVTFLASKKLIVHAYTTNLFGRDNVYGYNYADQADSDGVYARNPIVNSRKRFFFLGLFFSLKNDSAYDISSF